MKDEKLVWKLLETGYVLDAKWLKVRKEKVELPNGRVLDDFYVVENGELVAILAIDANDEIFLVKQYRHAIKDVTIDFPGGGVEEGESPTDAARRELAEETGMLADNLEKLVIYYPDSGRTACKKHIFLAKNLRKDAGGSYKQEDNEDIQLLRMPLKEVLEKMRNGDMKEATLLVGMAAYLSKKEFFKKNYHGWKN